MALFDDRRERDRNLSPVDFKAKQLAESACVGLAAGHVSAGRGEVKSPPGWYWVPSASDTSFPTSRRRSSIRR
jgi:hypothetical protein